MNKQTFEFNEGQLAGIAAIVDWYKGWQDRKHRKQVFFLTGNAGTGKTSLAFEAASQCATEYQVVFIAPTGKAASRLRQKGCTRAKTFHQFVYNPLGEDEDGDPLFAEKSYLKEVPRLVVLDEASMIGEYDMASLLKHGIPVLALGDLGQLPPVKAAHSLTADNVDFELTQIVRQMEGSMIIRAASIARQGKRLPLREYDDVRVRAGKPPLAELVEHAGEDSQILCSYNNTRVSVNNEVRKALGFEGPTPHVGEKVMCWFNQHEHNFMNGEQGIVLGYREIPVDDLEDSEPDEMMIVELKSLTDGRVRKVKFNPLSFSDDPDAQKAALKAKGGFQFGYCSTVHKAQGSEWPNVLVIDEPMGDYAKLAYTAWTRAQKRLTIYKG